MSEQARSTTIDRRGALALIGGGATLTVSGASTAQTSPTIRFAHGVASGDPTADGAVIWTRVTLESAGSDIALRWHVATAVDTKPVRSGEVTARAAADHTAKWVVDGLEAGRDHWFWFEVEGGVRSPVGRFRTLPIGATDRVVIALASCQLYPGGLFNAYADMAALDRLDAVVHLGDYIYEYDASGYGADIGRKLNRLPDPPTETVTLADYRLRHAQVKSDPDMQAAHSRAAFICVWDDHEIANDGWIGGAENHDPATQGDWAARKAAAMQAYFEWMPIRDPQPGRPWEAINRSFEFGDLATLVMVETRLLARSEQVAPKGSASIADQYATMLAERARPDRELLGSGQQQWLERVLATSVGQRKPWQVIGNQVIMARVAGPDLEQSLGAKGYASLIEKIPAGFRDRLSQSIAGYRAGLPFNFDSWDGYPAARERLYATFARAKSQPLVLSGDSHAAWANDLYDDAGKLVGSEFGATAITSPSYGSLIPGLGAVIADANPEVAFCDQDQKGYTLLTLSPERAVSEFVAVSTVLSKPFERSLLARYEAIAEPSRRPLRRL